MMVIIIGKNANSNYRPEKMKNMIFLEMRE